MAEFKNDRIKKWRNEGFNGMKGKSAPHLKGSTGRMGPFRSIKGSAGPMS